MPGDRACHVLHVTPHALEDLRDDIKFLGFLADDCDGQQTVDGHRRASSLRNVAQRLLRFLPEYGESSE